MRKLLVATALSGLLAVLAFKYRHTAADMGKANIISRQEVYKNRFTVQCSPDWKLLNIDSLAQTIIILPGWGNYQWDIASTSDSARLYFQQGINMYYSFHLIESMASFKKASEFDVSNAMINWSIALAYGPNINDFAYSFTPEAFEAASKAVALSGACTPKEKALISAMSVRYVQDSTISRSSLNQLYTDAMAKAYRDFPHDADVAALYADAMMLQHPWEYWKHDGQPHPWTPAITQVLEKAINISPMHPGANHYYIHMVEASPNPGRALASANYLSKLMPSVSHMVHMPSHIYIRSGLYKEGMRVNEMSLKGYKDYLAVYPAVENNAPLYLIHNLHMQTTCAMMGAGYNYSSNAAEACRKSFDTSMLSIPPPFSGYLQYVYMIPVLNDVRFGKWQAVIDAPEIAATHVYANILLHWARGMAQARRNNLTEAKTELKFIRDNINEAGMLVVLEPFNAPADAAKVAEKLLEGIIAEQASDHKTAITALKEAIVLEDKMIYNEPKDWLIPVRPYLGAVLIKAGAFADAEKIFREDLEDNPDNHWALKGLQEALEMQNKKSEAVHIKKQLDKILAEGDMEAMPVVY